MNAPYQAIRCADGYITLGAANERLFRRLCDVLGHPEWSDDARVRRQREPRAASRRRSPNGSSRSPSTQPRGHWLALLEANDIPVRADQRLRAGVRRSAGRRARDGRRDRAPDARPPADARLADQDERDAAGRLAPRAAARRAHRRGARPNGLQRGEIAALRETGAVGFADPEREPSAGIRRRVLARSTTIWQSLRSAGSAIYEPSLCRASRALRCITAVPLSSRNSRSSLGPNAGSGGGPISDACSKAWAICSSPHRPGGGDDLQADRQSLGREAARHRDRRIADDRNVVARLHPVDVGRPSRRLRSR